uniref:stage III sporulation protein AE n=1 Tax=Acetatifactor sp. TaxID=1872090 RepID=UPI004056F47D
MELQAIWQEYGLDKLEEGMQALFPEQHISLDTLLEMVIEGDVFGALAYFFEGSITGILAQLGGMRNILVWMLVLGIVSSLMTHFVEIFDKHQIADLSFCYIYLLFSAVLLKCFAQAAETAQAAIENIILFVKLLVPTYMIAVGAATGTTTVGAYSQLLVLIIYGVEKILVGCVIPLIYSYLLLSLINSIWSEEKLKLLIELVEKAVSWILKMAMGIVTGVSVFQAVITPMIDSVKKTAFKKVVSVIPGIGDAADGVVELMAGSAMVIKNSIGIVLLIILLVLCAAPLLKIFLTTLLLKGAAAFMGIVSDKRITGCANRTGDAVMMLFRTTGTAMVLFLITLAVLAAARR